jgi:hypothetical protein
MSVKFFGQFLIDQGELDASHVREALELMEDSNPILGELAIERGYLTSRQAVQVSAEQRNRDMAFGDLAIDMGFLESEQLVEIVGQQRSRRLPIGRALVQLGHLGNDRLGTLLDAFKADQAQYEIMETDLPDGLASHRVARFVLDLLPRFLMRVARLQAKVGEVACLDTVPDYVETKVSVPLRGARGLEVALVSDLEFAEALATASSGLAPADLDPEMVADGVGEFLNVLAGNAASAMTQEGHRIELGPPDYDAEVADGWIVDLAVDTGRASLVLSTF